ncbi:MAG: acyl-CoA dehydrogenase, partial [Phycisphaerales bacterium JB038]
RIYTIVEGSNYVMHPFIFSYGSKDMGVHMMGDKEHPFKHIGFGMQLGAEVFMGFKRPAPSITRVHPKLAAQADRLSTMIRDVSHWIRLMFKEHDEYLFERQTVQARISWALTWIHASACVISKLDQTLRGETNGADLEYELSVGTHFCNLAHQQFRQNIRGLRDNADSTLKDAAEAALGWIDTLPNSDFAIPEASPNAKGEGRELKQDGIRQFGAGSLFGHDNWEL